MLQNCRSDLSRLVAVQLPADLQRQQLHAQIGGQGGDGIAFGHGKYSRRLTD